MRRRPFRLAAVAALLVLFTSGCYLNEVDDLIESGATEKPWYCDPVAPNSVTGPGMGTVNFYAGQTRSELDWATCRSLAAQMDLAKSYAQKYPTLGDVLALGGRSSFSFLTGMGTHTGIETVTPELLVNPDFDPLDPQWPGRIDSTFKAGEPEFLQYNGNTPDSRLIGMSWYVRTSDGQPPEGFAGGNDWWHHHPRLCHRLTDALIIGVNQADSTCAANGGLNLHTQNYYMVHLWVVDGLPYEGDVFAPTHPCIKSTGAIFDESDPCHTSLLGGAGAGAVAGKADEQSYGYCPIGSLAAA